MKIIISFLLFISWYHDHNPNLVNTGINKILLFDHGNQKEIVLDHADNNSLMKHVKAMTNGFENNILLTMTEDKLKNIQTSGKCLEVSFSPDINATSSGGTILKVNKILLLLEGELSSPSNQESCLFLLANEKGYIGNVYNSPKGNKSLIKIMKLIGLK